jgi:TolA-binding protein
MLDPPSGDDGPAIARLLRDEMDRPAPALDAGAWRRLESSLRARPRRGRWALLIVGLPALATAAGSLYVRGRAPVTTTAADPGRLAPRPERGTRSATPPSEGVGAAPAVSPMTPPDSSAVPPRRARVETPAASAMEADATTAELDAIERDAAGARRAGDARAAERGYARLARTSGLRAENALFELGLVRLHLENDAGGALDAWAEYRRRFPSGQLSAEVDLSVLAALERAGRVVDAVREGESFLARRPSSERAGEVHALVGSLLQQRGDCARALPHLDAGKQAALSDARADELAYRRALCLRALGGGETARAALREYLDHHPGGRYRDSVERALRE